MQRAWVAGFDFKVRASGVALLLLATALLMVLPAHRGAAARQPSLAELGMAFVAVCAGSVGASLVCVGGQMFEPVQAPRERAWRDDDQGQPLSAATTSSSDPRTST